MGAALKDYESGGQLYLDGRLLAEITKFSVKVDGNLIDVFTTVNGLAGTAAGPIVVDITVSSAIPKSGFEFDYITAVKTRRVMSFRRRAGGKTEVFSVRAGSVDESYDVSNAADATVMLRGKPVGSTT